VAASKGSTELKSLGYEIFVAAVSILSIVNLVLLALIREQSIEYVLYAMNAILSAVLFGDFCYRLATAPSRWGYLGRGFGWADLLASVPLPQLKLLRVFRLVRVWRLVQAYGGRSVVRALVRDRAGSALYSLLLAALLVLEFGSLAMLRLEQSAPGSTITTASDALWYNIVTMATVGYGDTYPVTNAGRVLGALVIVVGVGIFGTLTGFLANAFVGASSGDQQSEQREPPESPSEPEARPDGPGAPEGDLLDAVVRLQQQAASQQAALHDLERRLRGPDEPSGPR
jgi:voltage-gated potassium channel